MATIMSGKVVSEAIRNDLAKEIENIKKDIGVTPGLAVIIVGNNEASKVYVRNKHKSCNEIGIYSVVHELPEETTESELITLINSLNEDKKIL